MKPTVEIDVRSGFCHGVVTAIRKAEEELERSDKPLYCLGDIVHNSDEVERLERKGLTTVAHADLPRLSGARVLLRAHGEPPSTYRTAREQGIEIIAG
ncbi:MAG: 4-hydroxy-3-methylbut-2-enyl diphosphate reductase, partial [Duncaniella sp.]|nr:4-hydroxy-3-methylbut-2-enyl diphosphate reductase [Duncaniella sp.]